MSEMEKYWKKKVPGIGRKIGSIQEMDDEIWLMNGQKSKE